MGKINQKQNGSGVTFGSGRSYLCLEERIEWVGVGVGMGGVGGPENKEEEKKKREKKSFQYFRSLASCFSMQRPC